MLIFWTGLNTRIASEAVRTAKWTSYRLKLWLRYTAPSIARQAPHRYVLLLHPELRHLTRPWEKKIREAGAEPIYDEIAWRASLPKAERYILARIDSDDLYHPQAGLDLMAAADRGRYLQFGEGHVANINTRRAWTWSHPSSPMFATVYGPEFKALKTWREPPHRKIAADAVALPGRRWLVLGHDANSSTIARCNAGERAVGIETILAAYPMLAKP